MIVAVIVGAFLVGVALGIGGTLAFLFWSKPDANDLPKHWHEGKGD